MTTAPPNPIFTPLNNKTSDTNEESYDDYDYGEESDDDKDPIEKFKPPMGDAAELVTIESGDEERYYEKIIE